MKERDLQNDLLLALGGGPACRVWRNNVGRARPLTHPETIIQYGRPGMADILGILRCASGLGVFLSVECKSFGGRESPEQLSWRKMIDALGGLAIVARPQGTREEDYDAEVRRVVDQVLVFATHH